MGAKGRRMGCTPGPARRERRASLRHVHRRLDRRGGWSKPGAAICSGTVCDFLPP